ncbi:MAG: cytochrome b/b6 domain-containing protein [Rhodoferax sp.]|uniref:cytochrome b n=1 Tax=Rhodoferax sp. TaxID=50421 RepID=UPI0026087221|nr:cytochrome b/b6 domain-containing protein [Rhodoferax sp.]MDD5334995.1 cytochrome b/b6 domain-containing protein [Rhodoferax sp.]
MQLHDTGLRFSPLTLFLHWAVAAAVLALLGLGLAAARLEPGPAKLALLGWHGSIGLSVLLLSLYRLWARLRFHHPLPVGAVSPIELIVSRSLAIALIAATLVLPLLGWTALSAAGTQLRLFGGVALTPLVDPAPGLAGVARLLHSLGAYAFAAALALHVYGALRHHIVNKDDTLRRMLGKQVEL